MTRCSHIVIASLVSALGFAGVHRLHPGPEQTERTTMAVAPNIVQEIQAGSDRYRVNVPQGYTLLTAVLENGVAWALVPPSNAPEQPTTIHFTAFRPGGGHLEDNSAVLLELPAYELIDGQRASIDLAQLLSAGEWLVVSYFAQVPGFAQPLWLRVEGVNSETRKRELVWQGSTTAGNHFRFGVGPGVVIFAAGHTSETGIQVDEFTYVRLSDGKRKLPISEWPQSIEFRGGRFVISGIQGRIYVVDAKTGQVSVRPN